MTEKSSAKIQAEYYEKQINEDKRIFFWQYCEFLLWLPIPMSYEVWSELHRIVDKEKNGDVE